MVIIFVVINDKKQWAINGCEIGEQGSLSLKSSGQEGPLGWVDP